MTNILESTQQHRHRKEKCKMKAFEHGNIINYTECYFEYQPEITFRTVSNIEILSMFFCFFFMWQLESKIDKTHTETYTQHIYII